MKAFYMDESGEWNPAVRDADYPVFVLGGIIADKDYADGPLTDAVNDFKRELFGNSDIILHTADIARNRKGFEALQDDAFRRRFYARMNELMRGLEYSVVACAVRKDEFARHEPGQRDLYRVCLPPLARRFGAEIGDVRDGGIIIAESRSATRLNRAVETEWQNLKAADADASPSAKIADRIIALNLRRKQDNIAGLQLADLVLSPIGRRLTGKPAYDDWRIVAAKILGSSPGSTGNSGLIILP